MEFTEETLVQWALIVLFVSLLGLLGIVFFFPPTWELPPWIGASRMNHNTVQLVGVSSSSSVPFHEYSFLKTTRFSCKGFSFPFVKENQRYRIWWKNLTFGCFLYDLQPLFNTSS